MSSLFQLSACYDVTVPACKVPLMALDKWLEWDSTPCYAVLTLSLLLPHNYIYVLYIFKTVLLMEFISFYNVFLRFCGLVSRNCPLFAINYCTNLSYNYPTFRSCLCRRPKYSNYPILIFVAAFFQVYCQKTNFQFIFIYF